MSSLRACALALPALRAALSNGAVSADEANGALAAVLHALPLHGQHEANQAALLTLAVQVTRNLSLQFYGKNPRLRLIAFDGLVEINNTANGDP